MPGPKRLQVIVDGTAHVVEIEDPGAVPMTVRVDGRAFRVEVREGEVQVVQPAPRAPGPTEERPEPARVSHRPAAPPAADAQQVIAPMPGTILEVFVRAGDHVTHRQDLCTLEAMKMKNAIRSPRDGVIAEIRVRPNQSVAYGDVLFVFE